MFWAVTSLQQIGHGVVHCKFNNYHFYDGRSFDLLLQHAQEFMLVTVHFF